MQLDMELKRTIHQGRKAYIIESLKEDGRKTDDVLIRSPDGDFQLTVGDTYYAKDMVNIYKSLLDSPTNWEGTDSITIVKLPT